MKKYSVQISACHVYMYTIPTPLITSLIIKSNLEQKTTKSAPKMPNLVKQVAIDLHVFSY